MIKSMANWMKNAFSGKSFVTHKIKDGDERLFVEKKHECPVCHEGLNQGELELAMYVCHACDHHFRITPWERVKFLADGGILHEFDAEIESMNTLDFPEYDEKIVASIKKSGLRDAVVTGMCKIDGQDAILGIMAFSFMGGSMGSVVGEKITRAMLHGAEKKIPVIVFTASGGARMQEGIFSLMQMAKTSSAAAVMEEKGVPFIVVLTDPTTGGVTASYAMLADLILSEPGALIGFAGRRVIEGTIKQKLPDDFQTAEFQQNKGFVDAIVSRRDMRKVLSFIIKTHTTAQKAWK